MACEVLVRATDSPSGRMKKGYPCVVRDLPWTWGTKEGLPGWVVVQITDADASEVDHWMASWWLKHKYTVLADTPAILKLRFEVDPEVISTTGRGRNDIKPQVQPWAGKFGGTVRALTASSMIVDFLKPVDQALVEREFGNAFDTEIEPTRFYFDEADVDAAIAAGGRLVKTKAEALAMVRSRLSE